MIKLLANLPDNTLGFAASAQVSAQDYEQVLIPAVEAALRKHDKVRLLYKLDKDFERFTPGAMWDDMKVGMGHLRAWEKIALVTDISWVANAANMFKFVVHCPVHVFPVAQQAAAERWLAA